MLGLKRGEVELVPYQPQWKNIAEDTIVLLWSLLEKIAIDIQHIGSTSIPHIRSKPIIDIAVGVYKLEEVKPYIEFLQQHNIIFRGQDTDSQLLFVMGDFEHDTRTHHIHIVKWDSVSWNNYINFRDYLNAVPQKSQIYDNSKQKLALQFPDNRKRYTEGKQKVIGLLLKEAECWKAGQTIKKQD